MSPEAASGAATRSAPPDRPLGRSAALAGAATLTSRILGLARESVQAAVFGASNEMDAFFVAFRIPNLARDLFAEGAMSAAFVPTFTRYLTLRGRADAWRLGNNVINALLCVSGLVVVLGVTFAAPLVRVYAGVYASVPGKLELTVTLTRILMPFLTLVAIATAMMGMLNSLQHYFVPALSPAMFNLAAIFAALVLVPLMPVLGWPRIMALAIGALLGGVGQIAIQHRPLRREGFRYRPVLDLREEGLQQILLLMGPGTLGLAATQVNVFDQHAAGDQSGHRCRVLADLRVPSDVSANRSLWRFRRHRGSSTGRAAGRARRSNGDAWHRLSRPGADVDHQRAGDVRADCAGRSDHASAVRARAIPAGGYGGDRRRAAVLRGRPGRLFSGENRVAGLLCDWPQPRTGRGQLRRRRNQPHRQRAAGAFPRLPWIGAQHLDRGSDQRRRAGLAAA